MYDNEFALPQTRLLHQAIGARHLWCLGAAHHTQKSECSRVFEESMDSQTSSNAAESGAIIRVVPLWRNFISYFGLLIGALALFSFILLMLFDLTAGHGSNPYVGLVAYLVAPSFGAIGVGIFVAGMVITKIMRRGKTEIVAPFESSSTPGRMDYWKIGAFASIAVLLTLTTVFGSYQSYHYTESVNFCGQTCHVVMEPEYTAYLQSPHARVSCAECHIGAGAEWYVRAKISGLRQVWGVLTNHFQRPVPTPIHNLRPARETCERCHWPQKFVGNLDRTYQHYLKGEDDEEDANKPWAIRLLLKVGGANPRLGMVGGIHWHIGSKVEYVAIDEKRQVIPWVRMTDAEGKVTVWKTSDFKDGDETKFQIRQMDCMDCHNRPSHMFKNPNEAVDASMALGRIDVNIPFIKRDAVEVLGKPYNTVEEAMQGIETGLMANNASQPNIKTTIAEVQDIYRHNYFPLMKSNWSVYPVNIGHKEWPGCARCHDGEHATADGAKTLASDCKICHITLAQGADPNQLTPNIKFKHPGGAMGGEQCYTCHNEPFSNKLDAIKEAYTKGQPVPTYGTLEGPAPGASGAPSSASSEAPSGK